MSPADQPGTIVPDVSSLAVCICTFRRPDVLAGLLRRLAAIARNSADLVETTVVIVDDDPAGSARHVAEAAHEMFPGGIVYSMTGAGDLAVARNRALELGTERADWLALTDDDCIPDDGWLRSLVTVQRECDADCVSGACDTLWPDGTPSWLRDEPFVDAMVTEQNGARITMGYTKNVLLSAAFLRRTGLTFDHRFGRIGGEDAMFFYSAAEAGMRNHFAANAIVREEVPLQRATLAYQLRRRFWYGNSEAITSISSRRVSRRRMAASGMKTILAGLIRPAPRIRHRDTPQWRFATAECLRGVGRVLGAVGVRISHR